MKLTTANGHELDTDYCVESKRTNRLYIHFPHKTLLEIIGILGDKEALPFEEYKEYTVLEAIRASDYGVNVDLTITEKTEVEHGEE